MSLQIKGDSALTNNRKDTKIFPDQSALSSRIMCHALSADFLVYGDDVSQKSYI